MPIQPVSGEIKAQPLNDNFSYLESLALKINGGPIDDVNNLDELKAKYPNGAHGIVLVKGIIYLWNGSAWVTNGTVYQAEAIADGSVNIQKVNQLTASIIASQTQNYNETAISYGYRRFLSFEIEPGGIISTTGKNREYESSIRSKSMLTFDYDKLKIFVKDSLYRIRLFQYDSTGTFESVSNWIDNGTIYTVNTDKRYRVEINIADDSLINVDLGYSIAKLAYEKEKVEGFDGLSSRIDAINQNYVTENIAFENSAKRFGYNQFNIYPFESGSINTENGNDINSSDSIRTPKKSLIKFDSSVTVINLASDKLRIKFVAYNSDGSLSNAGLWVNVPKNTFSIDFEKLFRIQISTLDGSAIDISAALESIKIVYTDDSVENLPLYWKNYLDKRIAEVRNEFAAGNDMSAVLLTTDTHFVFNNVNEINPFVAKYICDKLGLRSFIHLGDVIAENKDKNVATERMNYVMRKYHDSVDNFYPVRGNHDDNNEGNLYPYSSCITQKESYSWMFRRNSPYAVMGKTGTYYYVDNDFEKLRMIFLDVIDFPYADNGTDKIKEKYLSWGLEQLDWFTNKALKAPAEYSIAIFNHTPIVESIVTKEHGISESKQTLPKNAQQMIEILDAYVSRSKKDIVIDLKDVTSFEYFNGTISADFTQQTGKIVGWFSGHEHIDDIQEIGNTGIMNVFILNNSVNFSSELVSSTYQPERKMFDITEEVYDLLLIDRENRIVNIYRFGAGNQEKRFFSF